MAFFSSSLLLLFLCFFQSQYAYSVSFTPDKPLVLPLTHSISLSLSSPFPSQSNLLKSSSLRSAARFHSHRQKRRQLPLPLAAGADYTLSLSISSTTVSLYLDTGSDLLWFPCSPFQCILCENKPLSSTPLPPPPSSHPLPCSSLLCSAAHTFLPISDLCAAALCPLDDIETSSCSPSSHPCPLLYYAYGDGSLLASLRSGHLSLVPSLSFSNFTFACAHSALAEPLGVAGFGRGPLSLPSQLAKFSPFLASRFSYCLIYHSFLPHRLLRPSPLILGRSSTISFTYTPLLHTHKNSFFYSVSLLSISFGRFIIPASSQLVSRGMVVDSGTTFTMLPGEMHRRLAAEFRRQMGRRGYIRAHEAEERTGLGPCYEYGNGRNESRGVPAMGFHFAGNATVWLPTRNYFLGFESEGQHVGCLMVISSGDEAEEEEEENGGEPAGTLGNLQQQGMEVVYDLEMGRIGFARRRCGELWDSVSRG
ncbi:probable aspartyl protease At4g16563 [Phalaenopsis equestris]|uniref:probable aspartyl protease At4g16563 n=1 Tax=Phalaenopsis equestris TaxID=78828 RepID=UPI0009E5D7A9|nr:probable aspartyl protease At4g16563 [Phalaenopsis equestris]